MMARGTPSRCRSGWMTAAAMASTGCSDATARSISCRMRSRSESRSMLRWGIERLCLLQHRLDALRRHRRAEQVSLPLVAAQQAQELRLLLALHALGDHLQAQGLGERN